MRERYSGQRLRDSREMVGQPHQPQSIHQIGAGG